ncbi:MAG TPA: hypothetical protein ENN38_07400, partial [Actinobacteria bacterium]|nr:hypothetical protein [Actinomycetota bacterium]
MKKFIALVIVFMLLLPTLALAVETTATSPAENVIEEPAEGNPYTLTIFGYTMVIVPADPEVEGDTTTVGIFKTGEDGELGEEIATYNIGNILGKAVCAVAKGVDSGPEHGKTVSAFVKQCVQERRAEHKAKMEQKKEEVRMRVQEKKEEK